MFPNPFFFLPFLLFAFFIFFLLIIFLFGLIQIGAITVAFSKLGLSAGQVFFILLATLIGSAINIPIYSRTIVPKAYDTIDLTGVWRHYRIPVYGFEFTPSKQIIAVNVGGCLIPCLLSIYFILQTGVSLGLVISLIIVCLSTYKLARPIPGLGIGIPFLLPPLITVLCTWTFAPKGLEAQVAYISGSLGTLIGADILHLINKKTLARIQAPLLSIGGAGTFDGIFLSGIIAVLLA